MLPSLVSSRVYAIDVGSDPKAPSIASVSHSNGYSVLICKKLCFQLEDYCC